jgi:hypothetical protein
MCTLKIEGRLNELVSRAVLIEMVPVCVFFVILPGSDITDVQALHFVWSWVYTAFNMLMDVKPIKQAHWKWQFMTES